mmetsp:Transcript_78455/g.242132  ORF Transcript_78455/g.242132 Transcript_78455/m.242132 type:complete len:427 (-) Transcript_78455:116-1396(-)
MSSKCCLRLSAASACAWRRASSALRCTLACFFSFLRARACSSLSSSSSARFLSASANCATSAFCADLCSSSCLCASRRLRAARAAGHSLRAGLSRGCPASPHSAAAAAGAGSLGGGGRRPQEQRPQVLARPLVRPDRPYVGDQRLSHGERRGVAARGQRGQHAPQEARGLPHARRLRGVVGALELRLQQRHGLPGGCGVRRRRRARHGGRGLPGRRAGCGPQEGRRVAADGRCRGRQAVLQTPAFQGGPLATGCPALAAFYVHEGYPPRRLLQASPQPLPVANDAQDLHGLANAELLDDGLLRWLQRGRHGGWGHDAVQAGPLCQGVPWERATRRWAGGRCPLEQPQGQQRAPCSGPCGQPPQPSMGPGHATRAWRDQQQQREQLSLVQEGQGMGRRRHCEAIDLAQQQQTRGEAHPVAQPGRSIA